MPNKKMSLRTARLFAAAVLLFLWAAVHALILPRDLPSRSDGVSDAIPVGLRMDAAAMMSADTCKYGPLQYILLDLVSPALSPDQPDPADEQEVLRFVSGRILAARCLSAFMQLGTAFLILLLSVRFAGLSLWSGTFAAALFLLTPVSVFYSGTSNMDMPYVFWFTAAVFAALYAEKQEDASSGRHLLLHLPAGVLLACSFCTKDQIYAVVLLPASALLIRRFLRGKRLFSALLPGFLWLAGFLPACFLIYSLCGGIPMMRNHFRWITSAGSVSYAQFGGGVLDRLKLTGAALADTVRAFDLAVLLFGGCLAAAVLIPRFRKKGADREGQDGAPVPEDRAGGLRRPLLLFPLLAWVSFLLFFVQVVRYCHIRYMLALLPFCLIALCILLERSVPDRTARRILAAAVLIPQMLLAGWLVVQMSGTPFRQIRARWERAPEERELRTATMTAEEGIRMLYFREPSRPPESRKSIRHWKQACSSLKENMPDLFPSEPYMEFLSPEQLLVPVKTAGPPDARMDRISALTAAYGFVPAGTFAVPSLPSWMTAGGWGPLPALSGCLSGELFRPDPVIVFRRAGPPVRLTGYPVFAGYGFNEQLIQLSDLLPQTRPEDIGSLRTAGQALRPFVPPDPDVYMIHPPALLCCYFAYREAGREQDASALAEYLRENLPETYRRLCAIPGAL